MDLSDSEDDVDYNIASKYKKSSPVEEEVKTPATEIDPPVPVPEPETEEAKEEADPPSASLDPVLERRIALAEKSGVIQGCNAGFLTDEDAAQCREMIGYSPPNIMAKQVQQQFVESQTMHPALGDAFQNGMIRPFVVGVNEASARHCYAMVSIQFSRFLLTECITRLGTDSEGKQKLMDAAQQIRNQLQSLDRKREEFESFMAKTQTTMGAMSNVLKYNANVEKVVEKLANVEMNLAEQMEQIDQEIEVALQPIDEAANFILGNMRGADDYAKLEELADKLYESWLQKAEELEKATEKRNERRYVLQGEIKQLNYDLKTLRNQKKIREADRPRIESRIRQYKAKISEYVTAMRKVQADEEVDEEEAKAMERETRKATKDELRRQREAIDAQVRMIDSELNKKMHQSEDYRRRSILASDGKVKKVTVTRDRGWFRWFGGSYTRKEEYTQGRTNEKQRLEQMANRIENERADLIRKREALMAKRNDVKEKLMVRMKDESLLVRKAASENAQTIRERRIEQIQQQINFMQELTQVTESELASIEADIEQKGQVIVEKQAYLEGKTNELENFKETDATFLDQFKDDERRAREALKDAQEKLAQYVKTFGAMSGTDYASFMKVLGLLNQAIQNLPTAMSIMNKAFNVAAETFRSDTFQGDLDTIDDPNGRREFLKDQTAQLGAICELAFTLIGNPGKALLKLDGRKAMNMIENSGPTIEEVE